MKICETCKKEHDGLYGSGRFCSKSCSCSKTYSLESRNLISNALRGRSHIHKKKNCIKCNKEISIPNYEKHIKSCNPELKINIINDEWKISENEYKCPYCNKIYCKKGISTHIWRKHGEGVNFNSYLNYDKNSINSRRSWNKGLTKYTNESVAQSGKTLSNRLKEGSLINGFKDKHHSQQTKKLLSQKLSINNKGGRCKWFEVEKVNGDKVKVQGTWERDFSKVLNIIDENWIKPSLYQEHTFKWIDIDNDNKEHSYTPDFYSPKLNKYFEIKGYWWGNDKRKMELVLLQNKINVEIIQKKELSNYLSLIG